MQSNEVYALWWVNTFKWFIFPVNSITDEQNCTCGNLNCKSKGKHPHALAPNGHNSASNDPEQIAAWWKIVPYANIGVDCGRSGLVVLDCDGDTGVSDLLNWCASFGLEDLPDTLHTRTGGGGEQFFFATGSYQIKSMNGYQPNNDVKALGGYVVLPSSLHASGRRYEILGEPKIPTLLPDMLAQKLLQSKSGAVYEQTRAPGAPSYIFSEACKYGAKAGYRDEFFNAFAFQCKKNNLSPDDAVEEVKRVFALTEQPQDNEYTLHEALQKLARVYKNESIDSDPVVLWPAGVLVGSESVVNLLEGTDTKEEPENDEKQAFAGLKTGISALETMGTDPLTDIGNGRLLATLINGKWIWAGKDWYQWTGGMWTVDKRDQIFEEARNAIEVMRTCVADSRNNLTSGERESLWKWTHLSSSHGKATAMVEQAHSHSGIARLVEDFDTDPWILTAANCTIDLRTGVGREHRQSDLCTKKSYVEYDPSFRDARWEAYLNCIFNGDKDVAEYMQRVVGSMISGEIRDKSLYMAVGPKNTGKTTFTNTLQTILGDYAMFMQPENLMHRKMSSIASHEIARMRGKRLIVSDEPNAGERFNESLLKQMTGHDTFAGDLKYRDTVEFKPTFTFFIAGNQATNVRDDALKARIIEIPFTRELQPGEQDPAVVNEAQDPKSTFCKAALAWAVRGCVKWAKEGVGERPLVIAFATDDYAMEQDVIGEMLAQILVAGTEEDTMPVSDLHKTASNWWRDRGDEPWKYVTFLRALESRNELTITRDSHRGKTLHGWKINSAVMTWPGQGV